MHFSVHVWLCTVPMLLSLCAVHNGFLGRGTGLQYKHLLLYRTNFIEDSHYAIYMSITLDKHTDKSPPNGLKERVALDSVFSKT